MSPVPPVRTKAPSNSPQSSTSRGSSRFQDRYTSPTTTRIVDELLDEVVAHRLTPRDVSGEELLHSARPCVCKIVSNLEAGSAVVL